MVSTMRSGIPDAMIAPLLPSDEEERLSEVGNILLTPSDTERESPFKRKRAEVNSLPIEEEEEAIPGPPHLRGRPRVVVEVESVPKGPLSTVFTLLECSGIEEGLDVADTGCR